MKPTETIGELKTSWESDQLIVLGERESRSQGEGADVIRSQALSISMLTVAALLKATRASASTLLYAGGVNLAADKVRRIALLEPLQARLTARR